MSFNWPADDLTVKEKVGVGTDTPTEKLDVKGNIKLNTGVAVGEFSSDGTFAASGDQSVPTTQAVKTYTDTQILSVSAALANKADKGGSLSQNFQANNLTVQGNLEVTGQTTFRNIEQHQGDLEFGNEDTDQVRIHGVVRSTHSSGTLQITSPINVTGTIKATTFVGNGAGLTGLPAQWATSGSNISYSSGNVGIGTAAPGDLLDVAGNLRILTGSNPIRFTSGWSSFPDPVTNQAEISNDTGTYKTLMIVGNKSAGLGRRVSIWDRLEVNGTMLIYSADNPTVLRIQSAGGFGAARIEFWSDPQGSQPEWRPSFIQSTDQAPGTFTGGLAFFVNGQGFERRTASIEVMRINQGVVRVNGIVQQSSSRSVKENIGQLSAQEAVTTLERLNPVKFNYKADLNQEQHIGFIAEEVPDLVASLDRKFLSSMDIVAVLTKVLQEQQQTISTLKAQVQALEAMLSRDRNPQ